MGQYWHPVNLTKREYLNPHRLGTGLKLWEQLANAPGTGAALIILCAAMPEPRGGGDFDVTENWHGPERIDMRDSGPMPDDYPAIAKRTIGRWAGDQIALVGDYGEGGDIQGAPELHAGDIYKKLDDSHPDHWTDITDDVCRVIEHELRGTYVGTGWRDWQTKEQAQ